VAGRVRRRLAWTAGAGLAVFAVASLDLVYGGPFSTRLDPWVNNHVLAADRAGIPVGDVGSILSVFGAGPADSVVVAIACLLLVVWRRWGSALACAGVSIAAGRAVDWLKNLFERGFPPGDVSHSTAIGAAASTVRNPPGFGGARYAFPSGHVIGATVALSLAILLALEAWMQRRNVPARTAWRWRMQAVAACATIAILVIVGRVLATTHWLMDCIAALGLGTGIVAATLLATQWGRPLPPRADAAPLQAASPGQPVRVLGFTGMPGSGKSEAMEIAKHRGIPVVRMGDLIWEEVERRGLARDAKNVGDVANEMRKSHGKDVWSLRTVERVRQLAVGKRVVIIDGVRSDAEVQTFRSQLGGDFVLVAIHTDRHHRFERMLKRARADDPTEESILQARDEREIGWGMAQCIALADEMIVNDATLDQFKRKVEVLLDRLAKPGT
jgi:dephospho-CoA kinase/membrane-associated phospholipid phosphatase